MFWSSNTFTHSSLYFYTDSHFHSTTLHGRITTMGEGGFPSIVSGRLCCRKCSSFYEAMINKPISEDGGKRLRRFFLSFRAFQGWTRPTDPPLSSSSSWMQLAVLRSSISGSSFHLLWCSNSCSCGRRGRKKKEKETAPKKGKGVRGNRGTGKRIKGVNIVLKMNFVWIFAPDKNDGLLLK